MLIVVINLLEYCDTKATPIVIASRLRWLLTITTRLVVIPAVGEMTHWMGRVPGRDGDVVIVGKETTCYTLLYLRFKGMVRP